MLFDSLPHICTIYGPPTTATDTGGGVLTTWPTVRQANVPCLFNSSMAGERDVFSQPNLSGTNTVAFNEYAEVERGDLLVVVDGPYAGQQMRVDGINSVDGIGNIPNFLLVTGSFLV